MLSPNEISAKLYTMCLIPFQRLGLTAIRLSARQKMTLPYKTPFTSMPWFSNNYYILWLESQQVKKKNPSFNIFSPGKGVLSILLKGFGSLSFFKLKEQCTGPKSINTEDKLQLRGSKEAAFPQSGLVMSVCLGSVQVQSLH